MHVHDCLISFGAENTLDNVGIYQHWRPGVPVPSNLINYMHMLSQNHYMAFRIALFKKNRKITMYSANGKPYFPQAVNLMTIHLLLFVILAPTPKIIRIHGV